MPIRTVVKFHSNQAKPDVFNAVLTKTLGKFGLIEREWTQKAWDDYAKNGGEPKYPQNDEWWLVDVIGEVCPGVAKGNFVVRPLEPVRYDSLHRLFMNSYTETYKSNILFIEPKLSGGTPWIMPMLLKKAISQRYPDLVATIVVL